MASISIALSKGRIFDETAPLLARAGIRPRQDPEHSRKLIIGTNKRDVRLIVVRASDTPTYVQHGGADLGIAGRDILVEHGGEGLYTTRAHFAGKGVHVDLIRLYGSMELAPLTGLADAIVDLVATGKTLEANDLVAVEEIMPVSARLIVNQAALKTRRAELQPLIEAFARAVRR